MFKYIAKPFGWLMLKLYELTGSYGLAIILFATVVTIVLMPFMAKSKKGMLRTSRLQPRINELQTKHAGNQQKLNEEMQKLYREEKVNPMSGCLWSLIPFPILIALYYAIRMPITTMMGVPEALLAQGGAIYEKLQVLGYSLADFTSSKTSAYEQVFQSQFITQHFDQFAGLSDKLVPIEYRFLGLDISATPSYKIWEFDWSSAAVWVPALVLFCIPFLSAFMSWLSMKISTSMTPQAAGNAQAQSTSKTMTMMMPLMSIWICFIMPASMGIYWIVNSVLGMGRDVLLTKIYTKKMDAEDAVRNEERAAREAELERKRQETEALRAANATNVNSNTSKKKIQATQKQKDAERRAAQERAERAARRERLGVEMPEEPASQVGNRRYARGRAYVEDRYSNPEGAEAATLAAAEESEFGASIDESYEGFETEAAETAVEETLPDQDETLEEDEFEEEPEDYQESEND